MARIKEGDESPGEKNFQIPLYKAELDSLKRPHMNWVALNGDVWWLTKLFKTTTKDNKQIRGKAEAIHDRLWEWVEGYNSQNPERLAVLGFQHDWTLLRVWIPLQLRLAVEQVLWEKGGRWRELVTGFKPVDRQRPR